MSAIEFDAIQVLLLGISNKHCAVVRAVLVDGETLAIVGDRFNCSRQAVNTLINIFCDGLARFHEAQRVMNAGELVPPEWEMATLIAPSHPINKLRADIADQGTNNMRDTEKKYKTCSNYPWSFLAHSSGTRKHSATARPSMLRHRWRRFFVQYPRNCW